MKLFNEQLWKNIRENKNVQKTFKIYNINKKMKEKLKNDIYGNL